VSRRGPCLGCGPLRLFENSGQHCNAPIDVRDATWAQSASTIQELAVSEQLAKVASVTSFGMTWIDITYLCFNKLRTISG